MDTAIIGPLGGTLLLGATPITVTALIGVLVSTGSIPITVITDGAILTITMGGIIPIITTTTIMGMDMDIMITLPITGEEATMEIITGAHPHAAAPMFPMAEVLIPALK